MTVFKKTIFGKILGGAGKVLKVAAPLALAAVGGGIVASAVSKVSGGGLFSKIGGLFKKKQPGAGTPLGNILDSAKTAVTNAGNAAAQSFGESVGSTAHAVVDNIAMEAGSGTPTPFGEGVKKGFLTDLWENQKGIVIAVVLGIIVIVVLIFKKK